MLLASIDLKDLTDAACEVLDAVVDLDSEVLAMLCSDDESVIRLARVGNGYLERRREHAGRWRKGEKSMAIVRARELGAADGSVLCRVAARLIRYPTLVRKGTSIR